MTGNSQNWLAGAEDIRWDCKTQGTGIAAAALVDDPGGNGGSASRREPNQAVHCPSGFRNYRRS